MRFRTPPAWRGLHDDLSGALNQSATALIDDLKKTSVVTQLRQTNRRLLLAGLISTAWLGLALDTACADTLPDSGLQVWDGESKPPFSLDRIDGEIEKLADRAGRIVVVHFFATWCEPCRQELGSLERLSKWLPPDRITIVGVDVAEVDIRVKRFFASLPVTFPIALDRDGAVARAWGADALPTTFVLDRTLTPRFYVQGDLDWDRPEIGDFLVKLSANEIQERAGQRAAKAD